MVNSGDIIESKIAGKKIIFLKTTNDTGGKYLQYEMFESPNSIKDLFHIHPKAEERFTVISGILTTVTDGVERTYKKGDTAVIPAGVLHNGWNSGNEDLHIMAEISPAMRYEDLYAINFGLITDGKCDKNGSPGLLQVAVTMDYLSGHTYYQGNIYIQKIVLKILAIIGRIRGYKALYAKYTGRDE